jgi:hypothetical protein
MCERVWVYDSVCESVEVRVWKRVSVWVLERACV